MSFWVFVTSIKIIFSNPIHLPSKLRLFPFNNRVVYHCVNEPYVLYPFFFCGASGLFSSSGYHKYYEHSGIKDNVSCTVAVLSLYENRTSGLMRVLIGKILSVYPEHLRPELENPWACVCNPLKNTYEHRLNTSRVNKYAGALNLSKWYQLC